MLTQLLPESHTLGNQLAPGPPVSPYKREGGKGVQGTPGEELPSPLQGRLEARNIRGRCWVPRRVSLAPRCECGAWRCGIAETTRFVGHLGKASQSYAESGETGQEAVERPGTGVERGDFPDSFPKWIPGGRGLIGQEHRSSWLLASVLTINSPSLSRPARGGKCGAHTHAKLQSIPICSYLSQMGSVQGAWVLGGDSGCLEH